MTSGSDEMFGPVKRGGVPANAETLRAIWPIGEFWEAAIWLALCAGWIGAMSLGEQNGFGYFHQPQNSLVAPLIVGGIINAGLFWANAFHAIPRYLAAGRWRGYLLVILGLSAANVALQTVSQKLIILLSEPELAALGWTELALENSYMPPFVVTISALYKFARDWLMNLRERRRLQAHASALQRSLRETREELRLFRKAGDGARFLHVKSGSERLQIPVDAVRYVKSAGNYLDIVTPQRTYMVYGALKDILQRLPQGRFARIHRSYLVGLEHIRTIKGDTVRVDNADLPIGAVYRRAFLDHWEQWGKPDCGR